MKYTNTKNPENSVLVKKVKILGGVFNEILQQWCVSVMTKVLKGIEGDSQSRVRLVGKV